MAEGGPKGRPDKAKKPSGGEKKPRVEAPRRLGAAASPEEALARAPALWSSPPPRSLVLGDRRHRDRLRGAQAARRRPQRKRRLQAARSRKRQVKKTVSWPLYGYDRARTRYLPAKGVKPPFRKLWRYTEHPLLEFPPIVAGGRLFLVNNSGFAVVARRRHRQAALETADRHPQRLVAGLLPRTASTSSTWSPATSSSSTRKPAR